MLWLVAGFVSHCSLAAAARVAAVGGLALLFACSWAPPSSATAAPPVKSLEAVESYLESNLDIVREGLERYNKKYRIAQSPDGHWVVDTLFWQIQRLEGDRVFLAIRYEVGRRGWFHTSGNALFELQWSGDKLAFVGHGPVPRTARKSSGWVGNSDAKRGCTPNYYAPNPCVDIARRWTEFAEFNGLALNPESAAVFQAYAQNDTVTGDRLLARSRGQPDLTGQSVFGLQAEVAAMDLRSVQAASDNPCDLDPFAPRPCTDMLPKFRKFAKRHGLPLTRSTGELFEAYAYGDYVKADVLYAYAKDLPVPAYGYRPTGIGRDSALAGLRVPIESEVGTCVPNPYAPKPCPDSVEAWRSFAARYELTDNISNARIFQAYAEGELKVGDRLFASAKGVALDQLLEAAGVPSGGLVIEVYPGNRQRMMARPEEAVPGPFEQPPAARGES